MQYRRFAVDTRPYCLWDPDLHALERSFVERIDGDYFSYLAETIASGPSDDRSEQRAAVALRAAYAHGMETFFALLFAAVQAPDCTLGWMHLYEPGDLRTLVRKVSGWERIHTKLALRSRGWSGLTEVVLRPLVLDDEAKEAALKDKFGQLWERLGAEFVRDEMAAEYNSIKHGLRVRPGGFSLSVGIEDEPGQRASPERMRSLGGHTFGSSYSRLNRLTGARNHHRGIESRSRNWRLEESYIGLHLLAQSIQNVRSFLLIAVHDVPADQVEFSWPIPDSLFDQMWEPILGPSAFGWSSIVEANDIRDFTAEEILDVYRPRDRPDPAASP